MRPAAQLSLPGLEHSRLAAGSSVLVSLAEDVDSV